MATTVPLSFDIYARDHASSTFDRFGRSVSSSNHSVGLLRGGLGRLVGAFAGLGIIYKTTQFLKDSVDQARESNKVTAQSMAVLKSTGYAANVYGDEIEGLAQKISMKAGIDDEAIQSGENLLLTFRNIRNEAGKGNDIFARATRITTDLSVAMGQSMKTSVIQVGKALNDPIKGLTSLSRIGVTFGKGQVKRIKDFVDEGKSMAAQKVILRELNKEFKGSAAAQADPADKAKVAWENLQETIGLKLLPVLDKLLIWFVAKGLPAIQEFGGWLSDKLGPVISQVAGWFSSSSQEGGKLSGAFQSLVSAGQQMYDALYPIAVDIFEKIRQNWPQIKATISDVLTAAAGVISSFAALVAALWDRFGETILNSVMRTWQAVYTTIGGALRIIKGILDVLTGVLTGDWSKAWNGVKEIFRGAVQVVIGVFRGWLNTVKTMLSALKDAWGPLVSKAWDAIKTATSNGVAAVVGWVKKLPGKIMGALGGLTVALENIGVQIMAGLIRGIVSKVEELKDWVGDIAHNVIVAGFSGALAIVSPSRVMHGIGENVMQGLIDGITSKIQTLKSTMQAVAQTVSGLFGNPLAGENVNTVADIFRQQRAEQGDATRLRNDIRKLLHKGLDMRFITAMIETGNLGALHELANAPASTVRRYERGERKLASTEDRASAILNRHNRSRLEDLQAERRRDRELLKGLKQAIHDGMDGSRIVVDRHGHGHLRLARQGG